MPPNPWQLSWEQVFHPSKHRDERACGTICPRCAWKDIFDLFHIQQDGWEDAAVAGGICDKEQEVTAGDLLCHKHPAKKKAYGRKHIPPAKHIPAAKPEQLPLHHLAHSKEIQRKQRSSEMGCEQEGGETQRAAMHMGELMLVHLCVLREL